MAKGKLSVTEKYTIQGMLHNKLSVEEIAESLERSTETISKYINNELEPIQETIAKIQQTQVEPNLDEETSVVELPEDMKMEVIHKLRTTGMYQEDAIELLARTTRRLNRVPDNSQQMYVYCIKTLNAKDVMITHTNGGRKGVTVMTNGGSSKGDKDGSSQNKPTFKPGTSRSSRGNVFQPKDNRMM